MSYRKIAAIIFAAALCLTVMTACIRQSGIVKGRQIAIEPSAAWSETEKDCCHKEQSCCEDTDNSESDCCESKASAIDMESDEDTTDRECCNKKEEITAKPDCCREEESIHIPDCCGE